MPTQPDHGLHFINIDPSSVRLRSERIHEVRSHAGRWRWQQLRQNGEQDGDTDLGEETHEPDCVENFDKDTAVMTDGEENHHFVSLAKQNSTGRFEYYQHSSTLANGPHVSILDSFQTAVPSPIPMEFISVNNKYAVSVLWPGLMPQSTTASNHAGVSAWFSHSVSHSALHSSMLFGSFSHRRVRVCVRGQGRFNSEDMKQMSLSQQDSISKINQAIQSPSEGVLDGIILSVLCLANNDTATNKKVNSSPFRPPLRSLQWLDVYGSLSPNPIHQQGLAQLVHLKGGLERIELPGLAAIISFSSILAASRTLSPPYFPFISLHAGSLTLHDMLDTHTSTMDPSDPLLALQIPKDMHDVFRASRLYISLVEAYIDGSPAAEGLGTICDRRNLVQWHIMSLPPAIPAYHTAAASGMYGCCRLALTIFGVGVIFPLPSEIVPLLSLARMLQAHLRLDAYKAASLASVGARNVYCWCVVMGGIAASGSQERGWFVQELRFWAVSNFVGSWEELSTALHSVLWYGDACDLAGKEMWAEALNI